MTAALSVIVPTENRFAAVSKLVAHLRRQTISEQLEIVFVVPSAAGLESRERDLFGFAHYQTVEIGAFPSPSAARAAGIRAASAPVVALAEDHCFPATGWAQALLDRHREPWAAVGPVIENGNPESGVSWSNFLVEYGVWMAPHPGGEIDFLPGRNSSYKRDLLCALGARLESLLDNELVLHEELRRAGHRLYLEPKATVRHVNVSRASVWLGFRFDNGHGFAASRCRSWTMSKRAVYALGSPLIPWVRLWRILPLLRRVDGLRKGAPPFFPPALVLALVADAAGELVGYCRGEPSGRRRLAELDFDRSVLLRAEERSLLEESRESAADIGRSRGGAVRATGRSESAVKR